MNRPSRRRRRALFGVLVVGALALAGVARAGAQDDGPVVEILQLQGAIDPAVAAAVHAVVATANEQGSAAVVLQIDSPGGISVDPAALVAPVRDSAVPVIAFIGPRVAGARAAGSGALLALSAHLLAVAEDATLGPALPGDLTIGAPGAVDVADAATAAVLAEVAGGDADAVASQALASAPALDQGFADVRADGLDHLLEQLDGLVASTSGGDVTLRVRSDEVTIRFHSLGPLRRALHAVTSPTLVYVLLVGGLLLVAFELFQPGFGIAGVAALVIAPLVGYGLVMLPARWWALGLLLAGMLALAFDLAVAGLGIPTFAGAAAVAVGSLWLFSGAPLLALSPWLVGGAVLVAVGFFVVVMTVVLRAQAPPEASEDLVGRVGVVRSALNPEGHVFVGGALWRARLDEAEPAGKVGNGVRVRVAALDGEVLVVAPSAADAQPEPTPRQP